MSSVFLLKTNSRVTAMYAWITAGVDCSGGSSCSPRHTDGPMVTTDSYMAPPKGWGEILYCRWGLRDAYTREGMVERAHLLIHFSHIVSETLVLGQAPWKVLRTQEEPWVSAMQNCMVDWGKVHWVILPGLGGGPLTWGPPHPPWLHIFSRSERESHRKGDRKEQERNFSFSSSFGSIFFPVFTNPHKLKTVNLCFINIIICRNSLWDGYNRI